MKDTPKIISSNVLTATTIYTLLLTFFIIGVSNIIDKTLIYSFIKALGLFIITPIIIGLLIYKLDKKRKLRFFSKLPVYVSPFLAFYPFIKFTEITDLLGLNLTFSIIILFIYYLLIFYLYAIIIDFDGKKDNEGVIKF